MPLPLILEPATLEQHLHEAGMLIVDLCRPEVYARGHIPGAVHLEYAQIVAARPPVMGLLPDSAHLSQVLSGIGLTPERHVVAYDDEGGGKACRLLWTLDVIGHKHFSLLNGGLRAWMAENRPLSSEHGVAKTGNYQVGGLNEGAQADKDHILAHLNDPKVALLDARTPGEFRGADKRAARGGHIPGAVNMDWTLTIDAQNHTRLKPEAALRAQLAALGVTPDKEVITYCQTHHRSSHTYIVLKALGYPHVKGYPGAWSEWGNDPAAPVE